MIWCVEDDASIRDIEIYALRAAGFEVQGFPDGDSFWDALQQQHPDLGVLDVMLPGADDYLVKPFSVMELASRVRAVLRRCKPPAEKRLTCGGLTLNEQEHTVAVNGRRVELTYKEYELLRLFLTHPRTAFTRDKLMEQVWGTDFCGESRTVDMHIRTLRQKLGQEGAHIQTVRNVGYRWEDTI